MAGLEEEFKAYLETGQQSQAYKLEKDFATYLQEKGQGGAIRQAPQEQNFPIGATIGGVGGAIIGGLTPLPGGATLGGIAGTLGGEAIQQGVETLMGSEAAPQSIGQSAQRLAQETTYQLAGEGLGRGLIAGVGRALSYAAPKVTPEASQALRFLEPRVQPGLLVAEATESSGMDTIHNIAEKSLFGAEYFRAYKANREKVLEQMADELVDQFGRRASATDVGSQLIKSVGNNLEISRAPAKVLYNSVEERVAPTLQTVTEMVEQPTGLLDAAGRPMMKSVPISKEVEVGGAQVGMDQAKEFVKPLAKRAKKLEGIEARNAGDDLVEAVAHMPDVVNFADAKALRSRLLSRIDEYKIENKNAPAKGIAQQLIKRLDSQMEISLGNYDPEALAMWREANRLYAEGNKTFNNRLIRGLIRKGTEEFGGDPQAIARSIFQPGAVTRITRVKAAVDPVTWTQLQSYELQDLLEKGTTNGLINGNKLEQVMFGRTGLGDDAMRATFSPDQIATYKSFINAAKLAQARQGEGIGSMAVQLKQPGALIQLAGAALAGVGIGESDWGDVLAGGAIILSPPILAKLMTNPTSARWLISGLSLPSGSKEAGIVAGRLLSAAFPRPEIMAPREAPTRSPTTGPRPFALQP